MLVDMRSVASGLGFFFLLASGCASASTTGEAPAGDSSVAPVETEPTKVESAPVDPNLCVPGSREEWAACEGKRTQLDGQVPEMVSQHPMIGGPEFEQSYVEVDGTQIIVLTREPVNCMGAMRVVGTLRGIGLGGEPGTKESYEGLSLEDAEVTCQ